VTKRRRGVAFPREHLYAGFIQKQTLSIPASCRFFIRKTDEISRTLRLMHNGISFDKILPKPAGYFGPTLTESYLRK
jgi:hypothetical protein